MGTVDAEFDARFGRTQRRRPSVRISRALHAASTKNRNHESQRSETRPRSSNRSVFAERPSSAAAKRYPEVGGEKFSETNYFVSIQPTTITNRYADPSRRRALIRNGTVSVKYVVDDVVNEGDRTPAEVGERRRSYIALHV